MVRIKRWRKRKPKWRGRRRMEKREAKEREEREVDREGREGREKRSNKKKCEGEIEKVE